MNLSKLGAHQFKAMVSSGNKYLEENIELINDLNVFPVPDGDTGTNMSATFKEGTNRVLLEDTSSVGVLADELAKGLLMGARGNSGVILSQIFRGFSKAVSGLDELDASQLAEAFQGGVESAYKAVMKPVEGTILTVARKAAEAGQEKAAQTDNIVEVMIAIVEGGRIALDNTPNQLPVLKQVGVVDSGGKGLLCIYEGFLAALAGEDALDELETEVQLIREASETIEKQAVEDHPLTLDEITFGYCTEIMVDLGNNPTTDKVFDLDNFRDELSQYGDSLLAISDEDIIKVHIHTDDPGKILSKGQEYGELIKVKVDNMRKQVRDRKQVEEKEYAIISVASGEGLIELFKSIGVDYVIEGGQTMNPTTENFVNAIEELNAKNTIIIPNNKNIIMAAEQAATVSEGNVEVVKTNSIPQGISAMLGFNEEVDLDTNVSNMAQMSQWVKTGQITYAIRDSEIDDITIKKDDYMALIDGDIVYSNPSITLAFENMLNQMLDEDSEILMVLVGEDGSEDEIEDILEKAQETYPFLEVEIHQTDQPIYHYIVSVE